MVIDNILRNHISSFRFEIAINLSVLNGKKELSTRSINDNRKERLWKHG